MTTETCRLVREAGLKHRIWPRSIAVYTADDDFLGTLTPAGAVRSAVTSRARRVLERIVPVAQPVEARP